MRWTQKATIKNFYKYYRYRKDKKGENYLTPKQFREVNEDILLAIREDILDGGKFDVPYGMGEIKISRGKQKFKTRNYLLEKQNFKKTGIWKEIPVINLHTDGYRLRIGWYILGEKITNKSYYKFVANRVFKRKLAEQVKKTGDISKFLPLDKRFSVKLAKQTVLV